MQNMPHGLLARLVVLLRLRSTERREKVRFMIRPLKLIAAALLAALMAATSLVAPTPASAEGQTLPLSECPWLTDPVVRLYSAYFLRAPDPGGFEFWVGRVDEGQSLDDISDFFSQGEEFETLYGDKTNAEFVELIYQNVLERAPDQGGFDFWSGQLDQGLMTRGRVMRNFSESPEFVTKTDTNLPPAGFFSTFPSGTEFTCGRGGVVVPYVQSPSSWFVLFAPPGDGSVWRTFVHPIASNGEFLGDPSPSLQENDIDAFRLHIGFMPVRGNFLQVGLAEDDLQLWSVVEVEGKFACDALTDTWANNPCGINP